MVLDPRVAGLVFGYGADLVFGDPRHGHPVAMFGRAAAHMEDAWWSDSTSRGVTYAGLLVGGVGYLAWGSSKAVRPSWAAQAALVAAGTWAVLGGRSLGREGDAMSRLLASSELEAARARLSHLCARDATTLDLEELARASVESIAENTSDAVVAPLLCGAVAGLPGLLAYRAANTLDAMVGYRSSRYRRFGWAAARIDDVLNLVPARVAAVLTALCAPLVGGHPGESLKVWRHDAQAHPSPNAGQVEAAFAGALGVKLGGVNVYDGVVEDRGALGVHGRPVQVADLDRAVRLSGGVGLASVLIAAGLAQALSRPRGRCGARG
jgi:adenosylcobinamide-phosphate synthase